jgi:hypothetical protein
MHTRIYIKKLEASKLSARGEEASSSKSTGQPEDRENRARYQSWSLDHELRALDSSLGLALWGLLDHNPANDLDFDSERVILALCLRAGEGTVLKRSACYESLALES